MQIPIRPKSSHPSFTISLIVFLNASFPTAWTAGGGSGNAPNKLASLEDAYKSGVKAYSDERWSECIERFEETIHLNKLHQSVIGNCRNKCNQLSFEPLVKDKIDDLNVYELYLRRTECLLDCQRSGFNALNLTPDVSRELFEKLVALKPYDYLHFCYFQMNLLQKAASAAFTYLSANPKDADMKRNYDFYIRLPEVSDDEVTDLESDDYKLLYRQGATAYNKGQWGETVATMEEALLDYIASENKCRMICEGPYDQGWLPDLVTNVANHFTFVLQCKQKCQRATVPLGFGNGVDFLADLLNYIQIAYYHLDRLNEAARAVQSHLLLLPNDKDMINNKKIYSSLVKSNAFTERPEIVFYWNRDINEKKLLEYIDTHFGFESNGIFIDRFESFK